MSCAFEGGSRWKDCRGRCAESKRQAEQRTMVSFSSKILQMPQKINTNSLGHDTFQLVAVYSIRGHRGPACPHDPLAPSLAAVAGCSTARQTHLSEWMPSISEAQTQSQAEQSSTAHSVVHADSAHTRTPNSHPRSVEFCWSTHSGRCLPKHVAHTPLDIAAVVVQQCCTL